MTDAEAKCIVASVIRRRGRPHQPVPPPAVVQVGILYDWEAKEVQVSTDPTTPAPELIHLLEATAHLLNVGRVKLL